MEGKESTEKTWISCNLGSENRGLTIELSTRKHHRYVGKARERRGEK